MMEQSSSKRLLYDRYQSGMASGGDQRVPHLRQFVRKHFPADRSIRILDVGCGSGALVRTLAREGYSEISGVDDSPSQVDIASDARIRRGDGLAYLKECSPESIDVVVMFDVIEHLTRDQLLAFGREVKRVLRPNGIWLLHTPNAAGLFGSRVRYADLTHEMAFTADSLYQLSVLLGFSNVRCYEDKPTIHGLKSFLRNIIWEACRIPFLLMWAAETGSFGSLILSQNLTAVIRK